MTNPSHSLPPGMMKRIYDEYISTIPEKLKLIEQFLDEMHESVREQTLLDLRLHIHKIAGSAGTYGFPEVSSVCKQFEKEILQKIQELKDSKGDPRWAKEFLPYLDKIKKEFSNAKPK